jgi:HAE1 family hydrophobic/amphiphilic exporter-1
VNVQNRVALATPQLPAEVLQSGVTVSQASNSILLVYNLVSRDPSRPYSVETLSGKLDQGLTDQVRRVRGVGGITYFGNRRLAIRVWLDPDRLTQQQLSAADVVAALQSQNRLVPAGRIGATSGPGAAKRGFRKPDSA